MVCHFQYIHATDHVGDGAKTELRHNFAQVFCHHEHKINNVFRFAFKFFAQFLVLCRYTNRAGIEMAFAHHDAAQGN